MDSALLHPNEPVAAGGTVVIFDEDEVSGLIELGVAVILVTTVDTQSTFRA